MGAPQGDDIDPRDSLRATSASPLSVRRAVTMVTLWPRATRC